LECQPLLLDEIKKADALQPQAGTQSRPQLIQRNSSCLQTQGVKSLRPQHFNYCAPQICFYWTVLLASRAITYHFKNIGLRFS